MNRKLLGAAFAAVYVGAIVLANWLAQHVGFVQVWPFRLTAVAGVYAAGITFPARDYVRRQFGVPGRRWFRDPGFWTGIALIVIAAVLSYAIAPVFAIASGVTFLVSEGLDAGVFEPLRNRLVLGVAVSATLAAAIDSWLFLVLAHIPLSVAFWGQVVGKLEVVWLVGVPLAMLLRRRLPVPETVTA